MFLLTFGCTPSLPRSTATSHTHFVHIITAEEPSWHHGRSDYRSCSRPAATRWMGCAVGYQLPAMVRSIDDANLRAALTARYSHAGSTLTLTLESPNGNSLGPLPLGGRNRLTHHTRLALRATRRRAVRLRSTKVRSPIRTRTRRRIRTKMRRRIRKKSQTRIRTTRKRRTETVVPMMKVEVRRRRRVAVVFSRC